jgi:hypothetical protein
MLYINAIYQNLKENRVLRNIITHCLLEVSCKAVTKEQAPTSFQVRLEFDSAVKPSKYFFSKTIIFA